MDKLIITSALTGAITVPTQTPHLPYKSDDIADDAGHAALRVGIIVARRPIGELAYLSGHE